MFLSIHLKGEVHVSDQQVLYLSRADVESVKLPMKEIIDLLEKAFLEKGQGRVEMPPKPGIYTMPDAFIHAMPAYIPSMRSAGIKWVSGYPDNFKRGLPYISGLLILNDAETGIPYAVMDCTWITAYRTGAASGLAAKYLARPESETVGILACGVQGRTNLEALACLFPIKRVYAYDVLPAIQGKFVAEMSVKFDFEIVGVKEPRQAVAEFGPGGYFRSDFETSVSHHREGLVGCGRLRFRGRLRLLLDRAAMASWTVFPPMITPNSSITNRSVISGVRPSLMLTWENWSQALSLAARTKKSVRWPLISV